MTESQRAGKRLPELDAFKGILITLIVLGHNYYFSADYQTAFLFLYNFHVASFLLLPFIFKYRGFDRGQVVNRLVRILVPHYMFFVMLGVAFLFIYVVPNGGSFVSWISDLLLAFLFANESYFDLATGFQYLWFLPAMALLFLSMVGFDKMNETFRKVAFFIALILHCFIGIFDQHVYKYIPWGGALIGYLFVLGLVVRWLWQVVKWNVLNEILVYGIWLGFAWIIVDKWFYIALAGEPQLPAVSQPLRLLFHDIFLVLTFFCIYRLGFWLRNTVFVSIGRMSLSIFLIHPITWQILWRSGMSKWLEGTGNRAGLVLLTFITTLAISYLLALLIYKTRLQRLFFPKSLSEWLKFKPFSSVYEG